MLAQNVVFYGSCFIILAGCYAQWGGPVALVAAGVLGLYSLFILEFK